MRFGLTIALAAMGLASAVHAQQGITRVSVHTDWNVFSAASAGNGFADCWSAAVPKETVNTRGGQTVDVRRGDIQLMIAFTKLCVSTTSWLAAQLATETWRAAWLNW